MNRRRCWLVALFATLGLLVGPLPAYAAPQTTLVAVGDSFASGVGSFIYYNDGTDCYRSPFSYPSQLAAATRLPLTMLACSGATTDDVLTKQVPEIPDGADLVTVTVGGNDIGYAPVLTTCGLPGWLGNCDAAIDEALDILHSELPDRLAAVYAKVTGKAKGARVVVTGYPLLFNGTDCNLFTFFTAAEIVRLNYATAQLNTVIEAAAKKAQLAFVAVAPAFAGHAVCDRRPWINGLVVPIVNSYHPNVIGHSAYAVLVAPALFGSPVARGDLSPLATAAVRLPAVTSAQGPSRIRIPDLNRADVARAAARAGVTKAELRQLRAAQRSGASNAELDRLDAKITKAVAQRRAATR